MAKRQKYIITDDGKPCSLQEIPLILEVPVLMPSHNPDICAIFPGEKSAEKELCRTIAWKNKLNGSLVDEHPRLVPFLGIQKYNLEPYMNQPFSERKP